MISRLIKERQGERGFSLAELCLVIAVIGLAASLSWPALQKFSRSLSTQAAAYALADELNGAREKAVLTGRRQVLTVKSSPYQTVVRGVPVFLPDGSADGFEARFGTASREALVVQVKPTGEIDVQKL